MTNTFISQIILLLIIQASYSQDVNRINFGAIFKKVGLVSSASSEWTHLFQIPFLEVKDRIPALTCPTTSKQCNALNKAIASTKKQEQKTIDNIKDIMKDAKSLIPFTVQKRNKRAIFGFMADIGKSLFGFAKEDEVTSLKNKVLELESTNAALSSEINQNAKQLLSFSKGVNKKLDSDLAMIKQNHKQLTDLEQSFSIMTNDLNIVIASEITQGKIINIVTSLLISFSSLLFHAETWMAAVNTLLMGYTPVSLIKPDQLQAALDDINLQLQQHFPAYTLSESSANYYYHVPCTYFTHSNSFLYIGIRIPLRSSHSLLNIYRIITFPAPLNNTNTQTSILDTPPYFAISNDNEYFTVFDDNVWSTCHGMSTVKTCSASLTLRSVRQQSLTSNFKCPLHIFRNEAKLALKTCQYNYDSKTEYDDAIQISGNKYLLGTPQQSNNWILQCYNKAPQNIPRHTFIIFKVPCNCRLQSDSWSIQAKISSCQNNENTNITKLHPINLATLSLTHPNYSRLNELYGDTELLHLPHIELPNFNLSHKKWDGLVKKDKNFQVSLNKLITKQKNNEQTYQSEADQLSARYKLDKLEPNFTNTSQPYLIYISLALNVITLVLLLLMYLRGRRAFAFLPIPSMIPTASSFTTNPPLKHFVTFPSIPLATSNYAEGGQPVWETIFEVILTVLIFMAIIGLCCKCFKKIRTFLQWFQNTNSNPKTIITLVIRNTQNKLEIPLLECIVPINKIKVCRPHSISFTHTHGLLISHIRLHFGNLLLNDGEITIPLDKCTHLSYVTSFKLRHLISSSYHTELKLIQGADSKTLEETVSTQNPDNDLNDTSSLINTPSAPWQMPITSTPISNPETNTPARPFSESSPKKLFTNPDNTRPRPNTLTPIYDSNRTVNQIYRPRTRSNTQMMESQQNPPLFSSLSPKENPQGELRDNEEPPSFNEYLCGTHQ